MGNIQTGIVHYELVPLDLDEIHPIQGKVQIFKHKSSPLYVFATDKVSPSFVIKAQQIQRYKHPNLCSFYGQLIKNETLNFDSKYVCCQNINQSSVFWTYHNYTLARDVEYNFREQYDPTEAEIWQLIKTMAEASRMLIKHQIYVDLNFHNIGVTPHQKIQLYWGNAKIDNTHRAFYQATLRNFIHEAEGFSPQELKSLRKEKLMTKFDLEKCVVHSLGRLILLYANNSNKMTDLIDDYTLTLKASVIESMLRTVAMKYSVQLANFIAALLQDNPLKRMNFDNIEEYFQSEQYCELQWMMKARKKNSQLRSSTDARSQKSSFQISQF